MGVVRGQYIIGLTFANRFEKRGKTSRPRDGGAVEFGV